ncbi:MBL fold metallo-hydrolase [Leifsonia sp. fls2-241-R2A-40a]|uniref:MBL fold metallo-hydrolase n=1 Tax=Leifsonia sp. fls2-241-R2A-40a TaxID=3040290 RepID=UPI00254CB214|nr:MBL fold metallo-hydrolase [Leifsonia sp. fls2-241-R2A-40a]
MATGTVTLTQDRSRTAPRLTPDVVPGVHWLEHAFTNCYLLADGDAWTLVDAAFPKTWGPLVAAAHSVGLRMRDLEGIVLTHGHFDHVGCAARAVEELGVPVFVHAADRRLAAHPYRYRREHTPFVYPLLYPKSLRPVVGMVKAGALRVKGVEKVSELPESGTLDLPGRPEVVFTPGHTLGHCGLLLRDRETLLSGDALVTLDPYKGIPGAQIVAGAATADSGRALASLDVIAATGARVLLPGHGDPWRDGAGAAAASARAIGRS